jgi:hypothetical protein
LLAGLWAAVIVGVIAVVVIVLVCWSLRGTQPADRPEIIRALAVLLRELFSGWRRPPTGG